MSIDQVSSADSLLDTILQMGWGIGATLTFVLLLYGYFHPGSEQLSKANGNVKPRKFAEDHNNCLICDGDDRKTQTELSQHYVATEGVDQVRPSLAEGLNSDKCMLLLDAKNVEEKGSDTHYISQTHCCRQPCSPILTCFMVSAIVMYCAIMAFVFYQIVSNNPFFR